MACFYNLTNGTTPDRNKQTEITTMNQRHIIGTRLTYSPTVDGKVREPKSLGLVQIVKEFADLGYNLVTAFKNGQRSMITMRDGDTRYTCTAPNCFDGM